MPARRSQEAEYNRPVQIAILSRRSSLYSTDRLIRAAEARGNEFRANIHKGGSGRRAVMTHHTEESA